MKTPIFCKNKSKRLCKPQISFDDDDMLLNSNDNFRIESVGRSVYYLGMRDISSLKKLLDGGRDSVRTLLIQKLHGE